MSEILFLFLGLRNCQLCSVSSYEIIFPNKAFFNFHLLVYQDPYKWLIETKIDSNFCKSDLETNKLINFRWFSITFAPRIRHLKSLSEKDIERFQTPNVSFYLKLLTLVSVYRIIKLLIFTLVKQLDKWISDCWNLISLELQFAIGLIKQTLTQ